MSRKKDTHLGFFALMIGGLLCSLLLVLILDGTRWLMPRAGTRMIAEFLLSGLDEATAEALSEEIFLSPKGAGDCRLIRIDTAEPEKKQCITADGRILLLPSKKHFSVGVSSISQLTSFIKNPTRQLACINDVKLPEERYAKLRAALLDAFELRFPAKSKYEC
jgi:hypothetical protein